MKKLIYCAAALAAMIFAGSCQQENLEPVAQEHTVTYTVELPDVQTKAIGDASNVDQLIYEVWKTEKADERDLTNSAKATRLYQDQTALVQRNGKTCAVVTFNLVQDQEYTILFWAQKKGTGVYETSELTDVHYAKGCEPGSSEYFSNQENYAAFYAAEFVSDVDSKSRNVTLKRPFAQLNIATKNTVKDYTVEMNTSKVVVSSVATHFNVAQNLPASPAVGTPVSFEFKTADVPTDPDKITVNGQVYDYVAMNYVFACGTAIVSYEINTTLYSHSDQGVETTAQIKHTVPNVPLKENYRTNIVGNLLSSTTEYYIEIDDSWYDEPGDGTEVEVWDGLYAQEPPQVNGVYQISLASELAWLAKAVNGTLVTRGANVTKSTGYDSANSFAGKKFVLTQDIDLSHDVDVEGNVIDYGPALWTPIGVRADKPFEGTFDGQGFTIKNLNVDMDKLVENQRNIQSDLIVKANDGAGLFGSCKNAVVKNVKVENATIKGHYKAAAVVADANCTIVENCHVKNATILSTPYNKDDANNAGAIVGYLAGEKAWAKVIGCTATESNVTAYRDVAAVVGRTNQMTEVSGNTVTNVQVVADQTSEYKEPKVANAGIFVGYDYTGTCEMSNNAADDNTTAVVKVNTAEKLQYQANNAAADVVVVFASDIKGDLTIDQQEIRNVVIDGRGYKYDGTITIDGNSRNDGAETLLIKNVNFETERADVYFLEMNSTDGTLRYAHNVTVEDCTFKGNETTVGARFRQCYNIAFKNCEVESGHSLAQLYGCTGVTVEDVTVNAKSGVSFGTSTNVAVKNSTFDVENYAVRADASVETTLNIENVTATAELPVIARYYTNAGYQINFTGTNTLTAPGYQVVLTTGKDDAAFVAPAQFAISGADNFCVFPVVDYRYAYNSENLQYLLNNTVAGENVIKFAHDIEGNVIVDQKEGHNVVINGLNKKYDGNITIDGNSRNDGAETLLIENVNFESQAESLYFLEMNSTDGADRYAHNVTVKECTFKGGEGVVGARFRQCYNMAFQNCQVISGHSLAQLYGCTGVTLEGVTVNAKSGVSFGTSTNVAVKNSTFNVQDYAVRADASVETTLNIENVTATAKLPVVARKYSNAGYKINLVGANFTAAGYHVVLTTGSDDATFVAPADYAAVTGAEGLRVFPGSEVYYAYSAAELKSLLDQKVAKIALLPGTYEGTFAPKVATSITSASATDKAVIAGRVNVGSIDCSFENIDFKITDASKAKNTFSGAPYQYPGIVVGYGAAMTFEGCNFESSISAGVCGINAGNHADSSDLLTVNNCTFVGDFYAIRTRTLFNITNNVFNIYTEQGTLAAVWTWGNANSGANKVTFTGNTNQNANKVYSVQMTASNFVYDYITINVQNNTNFYALTDGVNPVRFNGTHTFVEGSEIF